MVQQTQTLKWHTVIPNQQYTAKIGCVGLEATVVRNTEPHSTMTREWCFSIDDNELQENYYESWGNERHDTRDSAMQAAEDYVRGLGWLR